MTFRIIALIALAAATLGASSAAVDAKQRCRLEQQCRWVNYKKVCKWVTVCREVD
jgi:hypothetical protein